MRADTNLHRTAPDAATPSLNQLVRAQEERGRDGDAERLCGLQVDRQLELGGLLDGKVGRLRALEDPVDIARSASEQVGKTRRVRDEPPGFDEKTLLEKAREPALQRELRNEPADLEVDRVAVGEQG